MASKMRRQLGVCLLLLTASCGSGIVTSIWASNRNQNGANPPPPTTEVSLGQESSPLWVPDQAPVSRVAIITNFSYGGTSKLRVRLTSDELANELAKLGHPDGVEQTLISAELRDNDTVVTFGVATDPFVTILEPSGLRDLDVKVEIDVDGAAVGKPVPFLLIRPPQIVGPALAPITPIGANPRQTRQMLLRHLTSSNIDDVEVYFLMRDFDEPRIRNGVVNPNAVRLVRPLFKQWVPPKQQPNPGPDPDDPNKFIAFLDLLPPASAFPGAVSVFVTDRTAGWAADEAVPIYKATLDAVHPAVLSINQETDVVLLGAGLVEAENEVGIKTYFFDKIQIRIHKNGRIIDVPPENIDRNRSSEKQIFFTAPPSPDGKPGTARLELVQRLSASPEPISAFLDTNQAGAIRYASPSPLLTPFVSPMERSGTDLDAGTILTGSGPVDDLVSLSHEEQRARLTVLQHHGAGIYRQSGQPLTTESSAGAGGRSPVGVERVDLDANGLDDFVVVGGKPDSSITLGQHALTTATDASQEPLEVENTVLTTNSQVVDHAAADFDGDGRPDLVVLPDAKALSPRPEIWTGLGGSAAVSFVTTPAGVHGRFVHARDLNGDGKPDLAFATSGSDATDPFHLFVAIGAGGTAFDPVRSQKIDFGKPLELSTNETLLDVVSVASSTRAGASRHLCLLIAGPEPKLAPVFFDDRTGRFLPPDKAHVLLLQGAGTALAASTMNITGDSVEEIVISVEKDGVGQLLGFSLAAGKPPVAVPFPKTSGIGQTTSIVPDVRLWVGRGKRNGQVVRGLLVAHQQTIENATVAMTSAFPVIAGKITSRQPVLPLESSPDSIATGDLDGDGVRNDLATLSGNVLELMLAKGPGLFTSQSLSTTAVAVASVQQISGPDLLVWLEQPGSKTLDLKVRLGSGNVVSKSLSDFLALVAKGNPINLSADTRLLADDGTGDGLPDLAVLLTPGGVSPGQTRSVLFFLRAKSEVSSSELPFFIPDPKNAGVTTLLGPAAREPSIGNLMGHSNAVPGAELVVAVDKQLEFYELRLAEPGGDAFTRNTSLTLSFNDQVRHPLIRELETVVSGSSSRSASFEEVSLIVGDRVVTYHNLLFDKNNPRLELSQELSYPGKNPIGLATGDFDGDGLLDLLVVAERYDKPLPVAALFRNKLQARFQQAYVYPNILIGTEVPESFACLDLDGNGLLDVVLGRFPLFSR